MSFSQTTGSVIIINNGGGGNGGGNEANPPILQNQYVVDFNVMGAVNGVNTTFTTNQNFVANTLAVFLNGLLLTGGGVDYTEMQPNTITLVQAPLPGDKVEAIYITEVTTA